MIDITSMEKTGSIETFSVIFEQEVNGITKEYEAIVQIINTENMAIPEKIIVIVIGGDIMVTDEEKEQIFKMVEK